MPKGKVIYLWIDENGNSKAGLELPSNEIVTHILDINPGENFTIYNGNLKKVKVQPLRGHFADVDVDAGDRGEN